MLQAGSRKRPAPGASPFSPQSQAPLDPIFSPPQMSLNQYSKYNQANRASTPSTYPDPSPNYSQVPSSPMPQQQPASSQMTRRPPTQSIAERTTYPNGSADMWPSLSANGVQQLGEAAWGNSGDDLDHKALVAQGDAQAKRKQIPPFVQKLSRSASPNFSPRKTTIC